MKVTKPDNFIYERVTQNILVVSRSFYPMNSPRSLRTTELVKEFALQGHDVTLLTVKKRKEHSAFEKEYGISIKELGKLTFPEIKVDQGGAFLRLLKRVLRRILLLLFEYPDIELAFKVNKALQKEYGYDMLITIAKPHPIHWGAALARQKNAKLTKLWIADCGDPYSGLENDSFKKLFYFSWIEKWAFKNVDYITIPFEGAKSAYLDIFHHKIRIIPQGFSFPQKRVHSQEETSESDVISFAYFGNIQSYLHYAIPFLKKLNSIDQEFRFIVYTKDKELFHRELSSQTLGKCMIKGYTDRETLLGELRSVNFLVYFPYQKRSQKPLKLIDYYYLQKPILEYCNDERSDHIFEEFLEYNFSNQKEAEDYKQYEIQNVCKQFLQLCDEEDSGPKNELVEVNHNGI